MLVHVEASKLAWANTSGIGLLGQIEGFILSRVASLKECQNPASQIWLYTAHKRQTVELLVAWNL
jgi:hypothetical protein